MNDTTINTRLFAIRSFCRVLLFAALVATFTFSAQRALAAGCGISVSDGTPSTNLSYSCTCSADYLGVSATVDGPCGSKGNGSVTKSVNSGSVSCVMSGGNYEVYCDGGNDALQGDPVQWYSIGPTTVKSICTATTCAAEGKNCDIIDNGCGGTLNCGSCTSPQSCGGGGTANVCGGSTCTATTCAAQGKNCGSISDGCSGTLSCGSCTSPQSCGGGGTANVCGGGDAVPPAGSITAVPNPISDRLTSSGSPTGTIAGIFSDNIIVQIIKLVISRGPSSTRCASLSSDWYPGVGWGQGCQVAAQFSPTFTPGATASWSTTSTPPLSEMTSGLDYRVYASAFDAVGNFSGWIQRDTLFVCTAPAFPSSAWTAQGCQVAPCALSTQMKFTATDSCGFATSTCADDNACYHNICGALGSTCTRIGGASSNDCTTPGFMGAAPAGCGFAAPACTLTASPDRLITPPSKSSTLTWNCTSVLACSFNPNIVAVPVVDYTASGTVSVAPTSTTVYDLNCSGADGSAITTRATVDVQVFMFNNGVLKEVKAQ